MAKDRLPGAGGLILIDHLRAYPAEIALIVGVIVTLVAAVVGLLVLNRRLWQARQHARRAIEQREKMAEDVPVGIFSLVEHPGGEKAIEYVSDRCLDLLGVSREAIEQRFENVYSRIHPDDIDRVSARTASDVAVEPWEMEFRVCRAQRIGVLRVAAIPRQQDGVIYWSGIVSDLTEQREAELQFQTLFQQSPLAIMVHDPDSGELIDANSAAWHAYGFEDFESFRSARLFQDAPYRREEAMQLVRRAAGGERQHFEWMSRDRNGRAFWEIVSLVPIMLGGRLRVLSTAVDITRRRASEKALAKREALLEAMSRLSGTGGWELDVVSGEVHWTEQTFRIHDLPVTESVPLEKALAFYGNDSRQCLEAALEKVIEAGKGYDLTLSMTTGSGRVIKVRSLCQPELEDGKVVRLIGAFQDITEDTRNKQRLADAERRFRGLFEHAPVNIIVHDSETGDIVDANPAAWRAYGADSLDHFQQSKDRIWAESPFGTSEALERIRQARTAPIDPFDWLCQRIDGTQFWQQVSLTPIRFGQRDFVLAACVDVTLRREAENLLRESEQRFRRLLEDVPGVAILGYRADGRIRYWNKAAEELYGYSEDEAMGQDLVDLLVPAEDAPAYRDLMQALQEKKEVEADEFTLFRRNGSRVTVFSNHTAVYRVGQPADLFRIDIDLTERKRHERELMRIANYDALTGLPNRHLMAEIMRELCARSDRTKETLAICYLDLDDFKPINDRFGHDIGDQVLVEVASRLRAMVRGSDLVSRLGGDEFVVLLTAIDDAQHLEHRLSSVLARIAEPISIGELSVTVHASIGVTLYPSDGADPDTLLRHADQAMYRAKGLGRNCFNLFDTLLEDQAQLRRQQLAEIESGLSASQFQLHYQPKVHLKSGKLFGFEALVRWHHPENGWLGPDAFLPFLEQSELEPVFGAAMIEQALEAMATWRRTGLSVRVSVNVSGPHLLRPGFVDQLAQQLQQYAEVEPGQLCLEIVESAAVADLDLAVKVLHKVRDLGVEVAIDDFGTGYSTLSYLRTLPADELKIDRSFVLEMLQDQSDEAIVRSVIGLADAFGIRVVAEGVETEAHVKRLIELGCELGQGYAFAPAMEPDKVLDWIKSSAKTET